MKNLTIWKEKKLTVKKLAKTPAKPRDFEGAMQALQKASGLVEHRVIPMRCARYDKPFALIYKRGADDTRYRIEKIVKQAPKAAPKAGLLTRHFSGETGKKATYDQSEFDISGYACPWCGHGRSTVLCGKCNETYCASTVTTRPDGSRYHECVSWCGHKGVLSAYHAVDGHQAKAVTNGKSRKALSWKSENAKIGYEDRKRLPKL